MRERTPFPRRLLEELPQLKLLITTGMRNASIDVDAARDLGITVCGTRGQGYPTAELTWALILALDVHFVSSLPVMQRPVYRAWVDTRPVQISWVERLPTLAPDVVDDASD
jgi:lactate dehydrogenase-like 2-hydroxyacid dehydrogenase